MNKKRKINIIVFTGQRSDFSILKPVIQSLNNDESFKMKLVVTGSHLSASYGMTESEIKEQKISIYTKIDMLKKGNDETAVLQSMGSFLISLSNFLKKQSTDLILICGDRYEIFCVAQAALIFKIPLVHLHGGELTKGLYDDAIRHSVSKMSQIHFVSNKIYKDRLQAMGENPSSIYVTGAPGLDNIKNLKYISKKDLSKKLNFDIDKPYFLITYHPVTLANSQSTKPFENLLSALNQFKDFNQIFTLPNSDPYSELIKKIIIKHVNKKPDSRYFSQSVGNFIYLNLLKNCELVIGNSSSGIIEAPSFKIPTINIGERQEGRLKAKSTIDCDTNKQQIIKSIETAIEKKFKTICARVVNPYGDGMSSKRIVKILKDLKYPLQIKKEFYNIKVP